MIAEDVLERWLAEATDDVELPDDGLDAAMAAIGEPSATGPLWGARLATKRVAAAAAVAVFVVVAGSVALAHHGGGSPGATSATSATERKAVAGTSATGGAGSTGTASSPESAAVPTPAPTAGPQLGAVSGGTSESGGGSAPVPSTVVLGEPTTLPDQRVVRTATVDLQVPKGGTAAALAKVRALVGADGYVAGSSSSLQGDDPGGTITLRVPSADYTRVRDALAGGQYGTVESLQEQGQDVTAQYTDLQARLTALEETRATYLQILAKATTIGDTLAVEQQITAVQTQIEQLQGQEKVLADQSDDATITVTIDEPGAKAHHRNAWTHAFARAGRSVVHAVQGLIAASGVALLVVIVLVLIAVALRLGWRRLRRRLI